MGYNGRSQKREKLILSHICGYISNSENSNNEKNSYNSGL